MKLTKAEQETVDRLIRLGDSLEVAIQTVIDRRDTRADREFYRLAYTSYPLEHKNNDNQTALS